MLLLTYDIPSTSWRHEPLADDKSVTNKTAMVEVVGGKVLVCGGDALGLGYGLLSPPPWGYPTPDWFLNFLRGNLLRLGVVLWEGDF